MISGSNLAVMVSVVSYLELYTYKPNTQNYIFISNIIILITKSF